MFIKQFGLILILLTITSLFLYAEEVSLLSFTGKVEIKKAGGEWTPVSAGQQISGSDYISTGFGSMARLQAGGMQITLQPLTRIQIDELAEKGNTVSSRVSLQSGRVRAVRTQTTKAQRKLLDFRLSTPVATAAVRGTDFELSANNKLRTYEGLVEFSSKQGTVLSSAGSYSWASISQAPAIPLELAAENWSLSPVAGSIGGITISGAAADILQNLNIPGNGFIESSSMLFILN